MRTSVKLVTCLIFLNVLPSAAFAQQWQWARDLGISGGYGHLAADSKGNGYALTYTNLAQGDLSGTIQVSKLWKIDAWGNTVYTNPIGGRQEYGQLGVDVSDNLLIGGSCRDSIRFKGAQFSPTLTCYTAALKPDGSWIWSDLTNNYYSYSFTSNSSQHQLFIRGDKVVCVNISGSPLWSSSFTIATNHSTYGGYIWDLAVGKNDHVYVGGAWSGSLMTMNGVNYYSEPGGKGGSFLIELSATGQLLDVDVFPYAYFSEIKTDAARNLYILGTLHINHTLHLGGDSLKITMSNSPNAQSYFIAKLSPAGSCLWLKEIKKYDPVDQYSWGYQMDVSTAGDVFIAGYGTSTIQIANDIIPADSSVFIAALHTNGSVLWTNQVTSLNHQLNVYSISAAGNNGVYLLLDLLDSADFGTIKLTAGTEFNNDPYIHHKHFALAMINNGTLTTSVHERDPVEINVYPNPGKGTFRILCPDEILSVTVTDLKGRAVHKTAFMGEDILQIPGSIPGVYILRITTESSVYIKKLIVE
jgi:hypothetical protein